VEKEVQPWREGKENHPEDSGKEGLYRFEKTLHRKKKGRRNLGG